MWAFPVAPLKKWSSPPIRTSASCKRRLQSVMAMAHWGLSPKMVKYSTRGARSKPLMDYYGLLFITSYLSVLLYAGTRSIHSNPRMHHHWFQIMILSLICSPYARNRLREESFTGGEYLTAVAEATDLVASAYAFTMYCSGFHSHIETWGHRISGGKDNVTERWKDSKVYHVAATDSAFAAILEDGMVVTWGDKRFGGDCSCVEKQLHSVKQIAGTEGAFAAITQDGDVVTWGAYSLGGDHRLVKNHLRDVREISANRCAFAAICGDDRHVVTWGDLDFGGDSRRVRNLLEDVQKIQGTDRAFAALRADGSVVAWGHEEYGSDMTNGPCNVSQLTEVKQLASTGSAFAAILADGSVVTWGNQRHGGNSSSVQDRLKDVQYIHGTKVSFAAIRANGTVAKHC